MVVHYPEALSVVPSRTNLPSEAADTYVLISTKEILIHDQLLRDSKARGQQNREARTSGRTKAEEWIAEAVRQGHQSVEVIWEEVQTSWSNQELK